MMMIRKAQFLIIISRIFMIGIISLGWWSCARAERIPLPPLLQESRFIAYTPRSFAIKGGRIQSATEAGIRQDLTLLRPFFNGLITYSVTSGLEAVPRIAHELHFRAVILGIWDPLSETEINNVVQAVKKYPGLIGAVIIGNEGLYTKRYQPQDLEKAKRRIKKELPHLPVTTSEPFFLYFEKQYAGFLDGFDLLMPNVHPVFETWFVPSAPSQGVNMVVEIAARFQASSGKPLLIKESGVPSGPQDRGFTPEHQARFWTELLLRFPISSHQSLACFEAFDAPWKPEEIAATLPGDHSSERFWGFFTEKGTRKQVIDVLPGGRTQ
jgi:exo-beta-1,3-glucanase (GH17 family)